MDWYDKAENDLVKRFNNNQITREEFVIEMRELRLEFQRQAEQE